MGLLGTMSVAFTGDTTGLAQAAQKATGILSNLATGNFGGAFAQASALAIGFGVASIKAAGDFQQSMLKVQAYAGLTKDQTDQMSQSILQMASAMGQSPKAMADALYPIISSGYTASQALQILKLSAETSAASGAQMSVVADSLTTSLKAMGAPASDAGKYMDMLNKMVSIGKGEVPQYAAIIGKLSLAAKSAGVDFGTTGAALATLTTHGFPSVAQASTALGNLFTQIGPKVDTLAQHAKKLGLSFDETKFKGMSFSEKLAYLKQITGDNQGEILKLLNGNTLALKSFDALSGNTKDFTANLQAMGSATGTTDSVFQTAMGGWNATMARLQATFQVVLIQVGSKLLPIFTQFVNTAIIPLVGWIGNLAGSMGNLSGSAGGLSSTFSGIGSIFKIIGDAFKNIGQQLQSSGALKAIQDFGQFLVQQLPGFIAIGVQAFKILVQVFQIVAGAVATWVKPALQILQQIIKGVQGVLGPMIASIQQNLVPAIKHLVDAIAPVVQSILTWIATSGIIPFIFAAISTSVQVIIPWIANLISIIASVIDWITHNAVIMTILKIALLAVIAPILAVIGVILLLGQFFLHIGDILKAVGGFFASVWKAIVRAVSTAIAAIISFVTPIVQFFQAVFTVIGYIVQFFVGLALLLIIALVQAIMAVVTPIVQFFGSIFSAAWQAIVDVWSVVAGWFEAIWAKIVQIFTPVVKFFQQIFTNAWNSIVSVFSPIVSWFGDKFHGVWIAITDALSVAGAWFHNLWQGIVDDFGHVFDQVKGLATTIWQNVVGAFKGGVNFVIDLINGIIDRIDSISVDTPFGHIGFNIPHIPHLAQGGVMPRDGVALVGEQGPEYVKLPGGSRVYQHGQNPGSSGGDQHIHIELDGRVLASVTGDRQARLVRLKQGRRAA